MISILDHWITPSFGHLPHIPWFISLPEKLAWMAASKFILDAAIQFKLGNVTPSESLTNSNLVAKRPGR
jgi:hypothetical protein